MQCLQMWGVCSYESYGTTRNTPDLKAGADVMDTSLYELHVRDFSASDSTVPAALRGKYLAFSPSATGLETLGQQHLLRLSQAGLTHVHLLPSYDFGSVPERPEEQLVCEDDLKQYAPGALPPYDCFDKGMLEDLQMQTLLLLHRCTVSAVADFFAWPPDCSQPPGRTPCHRSFSPARLLL
jgi:hypothetical protein